MDINGLRKRYETLAWPQQLGNLASTLARVSARSISSQDDTLTVNLLREAALLLEWSAPHTPPTFWLELAAMQRELLAWQRVWPIDSARPLLALHTRHQSDRLLQMAGLVG
jgi:hypothetical protein